MIFDLWPALQSDPAQLPALVEYERGVWGKVHGAPTDFRWISRSRDFAPSDLDLRAQLNFGSEDRPAHFQAWRNLGDRCYAVTVYPSRAVDASGRRGFVEKQVLEWHRPSHVPAALGALLLLPPAAQLTDEIWWNQYTGELWAQPDLFLPLDASEHVPIAIDEDVLLATIERGRAQLRESASSHSLEQVYDQLLAEKPALLAGLSQPLSAEALAALLLPLPREISDRISIAAWIPSQQQDLSSLGSRWNVLVTTKELPPTTIADDRARSMTEALLALTDLSLPKSEDATPPIPVKTSTPPRPAVPIRPGLKVDLTPLDRGAAPLLRELYEFASDANRRWLSPESLKRAARSLRPGDPAARVIRSWVSEVRAQEPVDVHREQWSSKVDLLRSAAIVLDPDVTTVPAVHLPAADSRVPALLFALVLSDLNQWDALTKLGQRSLRDALLQSTNCRAPRSLQSALDGWLDQWQRDTKARSINVRGLIADARAQAPA